MYTYDRIDFWVDTIVIQIQSAVNIQTSIDFGEQIAVTSQGTILNHLGRIDTIKTGNAQKLLAFPVFITFFNFIYLVIKDNIKDIKTMNFP